jgi:Ni/Fe-hydrogenase subunit HybB-like protein
LWQTPWIGFLFLTSAIIMGFSIVIFEGALTVLGLGRRLELHLYRRLAKVLRWALVFYLLVRFADLLNRDALAALANSSTQATMFYIEIALYALPMLILFHPRWRGNARLLFFSAICLVLGGAVLRFNGLIIGYTPSAGYVYFPSVIELLVSIGMLSIEVVGFIYIVKRFPILPPRKKTVAPGTNSTGPEMAPNV